MKPKNPLSPLFKIVLGIIIGSFALGIVVSTVLEVGESHPVELIGELWTGQDEGHTGLYFLTQEIKHKFAFKEPFLIPQVIEFKRYMLHRWDLSQGHEQAKIFLADREGREGVPKVLGLVRGWLWLWNDHLEARDLETLEIRGGSETLLEANPTLAQVFPHHPDFFRISAREQSLLVKSLDAQYFILLDSGWQLKLLEDEKLGVTELDCRLNWLRIPQERCQAERSAVWYGKAQYLFESARSKGQELWGTTISDYLHQSLRGEHAWYALLSQEERSHVTANDLHHAGRPTGDVARQFYQAPYHLDTWGKELVLNLDRIEALGNDRFLKGGMLIRRDVIEEHNDSWLLETPPSVLVLYKTTIQKESPWELARLGLDGKILWQANSGLSVIQHYLPTNQTVVFGGYAFTKPGTSEKSVFQIVLIDVQNGHTVLKTLGS